MTFRICLLSLVVITLGCGKAEVPTAAAPAIDHDDVAITEADVEMPASQVSAV